MINRYLELYATYSIVARESETGQLGVAVQTHQMCVGANVPWLAPGIGALATQSLANLSFGPMGLAMLQEGVSAPKVVEALVATDEKSQFRQVAVVDAQGRVGAWTGESCIAEASHLTGEGYSVQANMMTNPTVVPAMAEAYESVSGDLAERMMAAMYAAQNEGGDIRGMQSAALVVVGEGAVVSGDPFAERKIYDLRVDEHPQPLTELDRLVRLRRAQLLDDFGHRELEDGNKDKALQSWERARELAPELEEMSYWQAVTLADEQADISTAIEILVPMLAQDARREHWIDLIQRIQACGIIEREGAGDELIAALGEMGHG